MTIRKGYPAKLAATDANDLRYDLAGTFARSAAGVVRSGVFFPSPTVLVSSTTSMNVSVAAFSGVAERDGGGIQLSNDGAATVTLAAAPGSNSRIDLIYAKQNDASSTVTTPDANNTALLAAVTGTAAASPVKPTLPIGALELATVLIPSTATTTQSAGVVITQTHQYTAMNGGRIPFRTTAERDLFAAGDSQPGYVIADGGSYTYHAPLLVWVRDGGLEASGRVIRTGTAGSFTAASWTVMNSAGVWAVDQPALGIGAFSGVWTITTPGVYDVEAEVQMDTAVNAWLAIKKNSTSADSTGLVGGNTVSGVAGTTIVPARARVRFAAGDTVAVAIYVSAAAQWSNTNLPGSFFGLRYVEPLR